MASDEMTAAASASETFWCALRFTIDGDLRFISHQDTLRLFKRAVARAALPVRFSSGFNPQPRIKIPLPRPLGIASQDETILIEFEAVVDSDEVRNRLAEQMPQGVELLGARKLRSAAKITPVEVVYGLNVGGEAPPGLSQRAEFLLDSDELVVERTSPKYQGVRTVDIKPFIASIDIGTDAIEFSLRVTSSGGARPSEVAQLLGFGAEPMNHRIHRLRVRWQEHLKEE